MIWKAALVALFAFAVALVALAMLGPSSQPPQNSYSQTSQQSTNPAGTKNGVAEPWWDAFWRATWREPINLFTLILALSTTALFIIGIVQIGFLISANETAEKSANAANKSADISKETLVSVQRAFLYPEQMQQVRIKQDGKVAGWIFQAIWKNSGTTPAPYVAFRAAGAIFGKDIDKDFLFPEPFAADSSFLGPQGKTGGPTIGAKIEDLADVRDGKKFFYLWGSVEFDDAFSDTPRHRVEFCNRVEIGGDLMEENMPVAYTGCSRHSRLYDIDRDKPRDEYLGELPPSFAARDTGAKYALSPPSLSKEKR